MRRSSPRAQARPVPACQARSLDRVVASLVDRRPQPRVVERTAADGDPFCAQIDLDALDTVDVADLLFDCGLAVCAVNAGNFVCDRLRRLGLTVAGLKTIIPYPG